LSSTNKQQSTNQTLPNMKASIIFTFLVLCLAALVAAKDGT
jgi:hypothetical protein